MKIAAAVILYQPSVEVVANIRSYSAFMEGVFVFDNSETINEVLKKEIESIPNCSYAGGGTNKGIAVRLNAACKAALQKNIPWLLTMDQDSAFDGMQLKNYLHCFEEFNRKDKMAMCGIAYERAGNEAHPCQAENVSHLITSGSIINLHLFSAVGGFDENLFIDQVDFEYCYRAIQKGFNIVRFPNIFLSHTLGATSWHRSIAGLRKTQRVLHSPRRLYYMTRNFFYVRRKYRKSFQKEIAHSRADLLNRIKNNLLYSKRRMATAAHIVLGFADYVRHRMGKFS